MPPGMSQSLAKQPTLEGRSGSLRLVHPAHAGAQPLLSREHLRAAARELDQSPPLSSEDEAGRGLGLWEGLLRGHWTLVDWFDSDGRRFIIVKPSSRTRGPRRGLTARERQVTLSAALGESNKLTGYQLGISPSRVSALLNASMRKLGCRTKAQLVVMARILNEQQPGDGSAAPTSATHSV